MRDYYNCHGCEANMGNGARCEECTKYTAQDYRESIHALVDETEDKLFLAQIYTILHRRKAKEYKSAV